MADNEKLEKSWKQKMLGALGAAAFAIPHTKEVGASPSEEIRHEEVVESPGFKPEDFAVSPGEHEVDHFLAPIKMLESSGGKNTNHQKVNYGLQAGTTAIGNYAVMPRSVQNVAGMLANPKSILMSKLGHNFKDEEITELAKQSTEHIEKYLKKNPASARKVARYLATHVLSIHNGDVARAAHAWRFGTNRPSHKITDQMLNDSGYVKKFKEYYSKMNPARNIASE